MDEELRDDIYEEPIIEIETIPQPEAVLTQAEDGSWRHTEDSPFSPFYVPDRKQKKNNRITIALVGILLLFLIIGMIFAVSKLVEAAMGEATVAWNEGSSAMEDFFEGFKDAFESEPQEEEIPFAEPEYGSDDSYLEEMEEWAEFFKQFEDYEDFPDSDDYLEEYYDGFNYDENGIYQPTPEDDYYLELADCIRDDLSYTVEFVDYEVYEPEQNLDIWIQYAQISGDSPYVDDINEYLEDGAMYYAEQFNTMTTSDLTLVAMSYVTYMDENTLSVVVNERYSYAGEEQFDLYCMNFDLTTGSLLYNTEVIEVSEELAEAFRKQSLYQNGDMTAVSQFSNDEIMELLADEYSLILYYTPVGLEIGYNFSDGWVTATLKEYEKYLKTL